MKPVFPRFIEDLILKRKRDGRSVTSTPLRGVSQISELAID